MYFLTLLFIVNLESIFLSIVFFDDNIYSFSSNGLFSLDINSKAILRNNNSLNLVNLRVVETTKNSEYLILGLQDGNIVIYNSEESHIINLGFDEEEATINSLNIHDETLYASTSQGLYLISITEKYIIENYNRNNHDTCINLALLPLQIRGFGHVKEEAILKFSKIRSNLKEIISGDHPNQKLSAAE